MRQGLTWLVAGLMVVGVMGFVWAQGGQQPQQGDRGQQGERAGGERGARGGQMMMPPGAYLTVNEASLAIWQRIGQLQTQTHVKTWELSLLHAQGATEEQIAAKVAELRALNEEMRTQNTAIREYVVYPEGMFQGRGEGAGQQGAGRQGGGGQQGGGPQ
ncbi:MAG: hypothetical protein ACOX9R_14690 [Armatimonadota bacterium]|jgi:hypothetical protein